MCAFLEAPDARLQLSIACLCLRLTTVATSMTAKKNAGMPTTPLLVQLARGDVTRKTSAELHIILENISQDPALSSDVGLVVERVLVTMGDLVLRFGQYSNYPCRVVLLSRKFHPGGFYAEALNLLTGDPDKLDRGYSLLLRQEAWNAGPNITTALAHIMSDDVQEEINTLAVCVHGTTLDVERKHNLDRRVQQRTVNSLAKASRDSFIREWRKQAGLGHAAAPAALERQKRALLARQKRKASYMGVSALAISKRPDLLQQDQGLKDYITAHEQDLRAALAKVKADAAAALEQHDSQAKKPFQASWPLSRNNWVAWLDEHHEDFLCLLKDMRAGARRQVNARVLADPSLPELGSAAPLVPKAKTARPSWARLVRSGWYALHLTETAAPVAPPPAAPAVPPQRLVLFVVSAGRKTAAWAPREIPGRGYEIACDTDVAQLLKPLWEVAPAAFLTKGVKVFRLGMLGSRDGKQYWMRPFRAVEVLVPPRVRSGKGGVEESGRSSGSDVNTESGRSSGIDHKDGKDVPGSSSSSASDGGVSFASTEDSSLEEGSDSDPPPAAPAAKLPAAESEDSEDVPAKARAAAHTHTAWSNDYFVLTDNRNYKDVRMRVHPRWTGPLHLGSTLALKTLVPAHFGDTRSEPDQIVLVLKAWMLYRWQGNGGRFLERRSRKEAWERERDALAIDIRKRGGPAALHANARANIHEWAPEVLQRAAAPAAMEVAAPG